MLSAVLVLLYFLPTSAIHVFECRQLLWQYFLTLQHLAPDGVLVLGAPAAAPSASAASASSPTVAQYHPWFTHESLKDDENADDGDDQGSSGMHRYISCLRRRANLASDSDDALYTLLLPQHVFAPNLRESIIKLLRVWSAAQRAGGGGGGHSKKRNKKKKKNKSKDGAASATIPAPVGEVAAAADASSMLEELRARESLMAQLNDDLVSSQATARRVQEQLSAAIRDRDEAKEKLQDRMLCVVCLNNVRTVVFEPCRHFALCAECASFCPRPTLPPPPPRGAEDFLSPPAVAAFCSVSSFSSSFCHLSADCTCSPSSRPAHHHHRRPCPRLHSVACRVLFWCHLSADRADDRLVRNCRCQQPRLVCQPRVPAAAVVVVGRRRCQSHHQPRQPCAVAAADSRRPGSGIHRRYWLLAPEQQSRTHRV
jgi:hypothetical protein